jgi:hypothetical protein
MPTLKIPFLAVPLEGTLDAAKLANTRFDDAAFWPTGLKPPQGAVKVPTTGLTISAGI